MRRLQNKGGATSSLPILHRIVGSGDAAPPMQEVLQTTPPSFLYEGEVCSIVQDVIYYTHSFFAGVAEWQTQRT